jgi:hypothetical protein
VSPSATATSGDELSEENVVRERLYFDVTGHSFTREDPNPEQTLGPCTGQRTFAAALPTPGVSTIGSRLVGGEDGLHVVEQLAQTGTADEALAAADEIVSAVDECAAISGGDFGYGDPVTVEAAGDRKVVYFPAFDSDRAYGGYVVFAVGPRVGVLEIADAITAKQVAKLATEASAIAGD